MDKNKQIEYFENLLAKHGPNYLALDWNSPESQKLRFQVLQEMLIYGKKAANLSLLDLGSGLGDLYGFFKAEGLLTRNKISYQGYDISPKLVEAARKKYPDAKFAVKDILAERELPRFDYVFCSGIFNIRTTDEAAHLEHVQSMLQRAYDLSTCGVATNFLSEGALPLCNLDDRNSGRYYYFKPDETLNFCRSLGSRYILRHDYHPGDFTVYLFK
jgi:SAM-dependent methyltransferase